MNVISPDLNPLGFRTVSDVLKHATETYGSRIAFSALGSELTFEGLQKKTADFAAYLRHAGLKPGDRIAIQLPNLLQSPIAVLGALRAGLVVVNTNPLYTATELEHQLNDSGAKALVVLANIANVATEVVPKTSVEQVIVTEIGDMHSPIKRTLINLTVKRLKKLVPPFHFARQVSFLSALRMGEQAIRADHSTESEDIAVLQYTAGTTGRSKAAVLTHGNLVANMAQVQAHLGDVVGGPGSIWVGPLPLYHIFSFTAHNLVFLSKGCHSLLIPNPRDLGSFAKALQGKRMHGFLQINALILKLSHNPAFRGLDFSTLKITVAAGAALTHDAAQKWRELTGCVVSESYGMSETSPGVTGNILGKERVGSIGVAFPSTELRVVSEDGQDVPLGQPGELWVRGPQVMQRYWNAHEETVRTLTEDRWLKSGDIVVQEADATYRIVDRKKDLVVVSGFKVAPNEVENIVSRMPEIADCAAVGIPDAKTGEAVCLFVIPEASTPTEEAIIAHCRQHLTNYKVPKRILFVQDLPRNAVGKVLRRQLRQHANGAVS